MFTVMIVDDNEIVCQGIKSYVDWGSLDIAVAAVAANGLEGYEKAREIRPDIVITDVDMPIMTGLQMASRLKAEFGDMDFIFISCFEDFNYVRQAMELKAFKYVLKPIIFSELLDAARFLCEEKKKKRRFEKDYEEMVNKAADHAAMLRERFFKNLLYGRLAAAEEISIQMNNLGIFAGSGEYAVVYIEIDEYEGAGQHEYALTESLRELLPRDGVFDRRVCWAETGGACVCCVLCAERVGLPGLEESLMRFRAAACRELGVCITAGVSRPSNNIARLPEMYNMARQAAKRRFYAKGGGVFVYCDEFRRFAPPDIDLIELKNDVIKALSGDYGELIERYYGPSVSPEGGPCMEEQTLRVLTLTIIGYIRDELVGRGLRGSHTLEEETAIMETLSRLKTAEDIKAWLLSKLHEAIGEKISPEDKRYDIIVEDIKRIIHAEYPSIKNVEQIVKPLYISASHANLIFKKQIGLSIFDYLVKTRVEESKRLLLDPYSRIYVISEKVGYKNYAYFNRLFQEHVGMTPKQFRNRAKKNSGLREG